MKSVLIYLGFISISFGKQVQFKDCGSVTGTLTSVDVEPCDDPSFCALKKGSNPVITIGFTAKNEISNVTANVHGIISGVPIHFPLPNPNGCKDSGLKCPLAQSSKNQYTQSLSIKKEYPSLALVVKWELQDERGKDIICFMVKARISGESEY